MERQKEKEMGQKEKRAALPKDVRACRPSAPLSTDMGPATHGYRGRGVNTLSVSHGLGPAHDLDHRRGRRCRPKHTG